MNVQFVNIASFLKILQNNIPYASGCLISTCLKNPDIKDRFNFRDIWWKRKDIKEYAKEFRNIDMMCVTNYMWNKDYHDALCNEYKKVNPNGIVVYGGIEIPRHVEDCKNYINERPFVDICFYGQSENSFVYFLSNLDNDWSNVANTFGKDWHNINQITNLHMNIEIPTPYIDGIFDGLTTGPNGPTNTVLETNRGCPYSCSFCDWGGQTNSKIKNFNLDLVKSNIDWIWHPSNNIDFLMIIDANFGIFADRDMEILEEMVRANEKYGTKIDVGITGLVKNNKAKYKDILNKVNKELSFRKSFPHMKIGIETHSEQTLQVIDRWNIKNEVMTDIIESSEEKVYTELILGLPGETSTSWLDTLAKEFELGVDYSRTYSLNVLPNAPMSDRSYIKDHGIKLKEFWIPVEFHDLDATTPLLNPDYVTKIDFKNKMEYYVDKKIYETKYSSTADHILMFQYQWWYQIFYNNRALYYEIRNSKKPLQQQILDFFDNVENMPTLNFMTQRFKKSIEKCLTPEPVTKIDVYRDFNTIDNVFKSDEILYLYKNRNTVATELRQLYPDLDFDDWLDPLNQKGRYYAGMLDSLRNI